MRKLLFLSIFGILCLISAAQQPPISHVEINNVRATILGNGSCYVLQNHDSVAGAPYNICSTWEVPNGSGKETLHQHSLWCGGLDSNGNLHLSALRYGNNGQDYWMGPLKTANASVDLMTSLRFHHVWCITRAEIDQFIANHGSIGYIIPDDILSWPAHGSAGYAANLAPFVDVNGDGQYNPADGDYPDIKGDQCLFFIFNDSYDEHNETHGAKLGLEIHGMVYAFNAQDDEALNNTVFVNYKLCNRSSNNYSDVYVGLWNDWGIGCGDDDFVGCDVLRNSCFAYNGTPIDSCSEPIAYNDNPPVQVCTILSGPDGMRLSGFVCHDDSDGGTGYPRNAQEYYNLLRGIWRDGNVVKYGGSGYPNNPNTVGPACHYMYPGDSDPDNVGTNGAAPNGGYNSNGVYWTEEHEGDMPGERKGVASIGPFSFPANSMKEFDYAMTTVWGDGIQTARERMGAFIDHISVFFDSYTNKTIKFIKNGTDLMIRSHLSAENDIMVTMYLRQGNTTFKDLYVGERSLSDIELCSDNYLIRSINDMTCGVGVNTFAGLYAQHGWSIPLMIVYSQSLDESDVGSIWADQNGCRFIIGKVIESCIFLIPEITMGLDGIYTASWNRKMDFPIFLTHISGAVHTNIIYGNSERYDLLIQQVTDRKIIVDGIEITNDGVYKCNHLSIQEHILGFNVGKIENWFPVPEYQGSLMDFDRIFDFNNGMNVTCNTILDCKYPFVINNYRGIQPQFPLQKGSFHSYSFLPKIKIIVNDNRIDIPFNSDDGTIPQIVIRRNTNHLYDVNKQPERCINFLKDNMGNYLVGMSGGLSLTKGLSVDSIRNANIHLNRNTTMYGGETSIANKYYPRLIDGDSFENPIDTSFLAESSAYITWFDPNINDCFVYYYKDDDSYILYVHAFEAMPKVRINLPKFMNGMVVDSIIEQTTGSSLLTERVVGERLYMSFNTDDNVANYIVLKLKSTWN
jgi:hypothetical protein